MEDNKINRVLIALDVSNFEYMVIWAAFNKWMKTYPEDSSFIKSAEETNQDDLPNLLNINTFKRVLHLTTQQKLENITWIARNNHQTELDIADGIDIVLTEDSNIDGNFRKLKYPEYKAQRKLTPKQYNVPVIKEYIQDVIFKELEVEDKMGFKIIKVDNCESDDIIAVLMNRFNNYMCRIILSADKDFLQLEGVHQYDMWGKKIERKIKSHEEYEMTNIEYLIWKILRGDISDNIKNVFPKIGEVKSYKLIKDVPRLKQLLKEDQEAAKRYLLNKKLIDFSQIPKDIEEKIYCIIQNKLSVISKKEQVEKFTLEGCMEL